MRFKIADGLLLCPRCIARGSGLIQRATVFLPGDAGDLGKIEHRARVKVGKRKVTVKRVDNEVFGERQRPEQVTDVRDQVSKCMRESWYHAESGEEYVKTGELNGDPEMHGAASASKFRKIIRKPR